MVNDRILVPLRFISERLGGEVSWDNNTNTALITKGNDKIKITIGSSDMLINQRKIVLDVVPIIISNLTYVPLRAIAESFNIKVDWDATSFYGNHYDRQG